MKQIAITLGLIIATVTAIAATLWTGSVQAAGALVLVGLLAVVWWLKFDIWPMVASAWREIANWRLQR